MALRDQPYLPLYVQDVLTDERLIECSAEAHGVYFRLLCIMHKQEKYGTICLKQKYKQNESKVDCFASMLSKQMPFEQKQIANSLGELLGEGVLQIEGEFLIQKRMVKDGEISLLRSNIGKTGGSTVTKQYGKSGFLYWMSDHADKNKIGISTNPQNRLYRLRSDLKLPKHFEIIEQVSVSDMGKAEDFSHDFFSGHMDGEWIKLSHDEIKKSFVLLKAKLKANTEIEYENENENEVESVGKTETAKKKKPKVSKPEAEIVYPFDSLNFIEIWDVWKQYRKDMGKPIKSPLSEQQALLDLQKYGEETAIKMIRQSIANSWQGIFPLKTNQNNGKQTFSDQHAELDRIGNEARERLAKHYNGGINLGQ